MNIMSGTITTFDDPLEYRQGFDEVESKLDLRVIVDLTTKVPNHEYLGCQTGEFEWFPALDEEGPTRHFQHDWEGPRRDARHDFAGAVTFYSTQLPKSLKRASLNSLDPIVRRTDIDQTQTLPNLVSPALMDPFSSSLRIMSNNLRELQIRVSVDESLQITISTRECPIVFMTNKFVDKATLFYPSRFNKTH